MGDISRVERIFKRMEQAAVEALGRAGPLGWRNQWWLEKSIGSRLRNGDPIGS